jgi:glyoxylase-like metal-dependent hydrolase (beta-lactamase superfamily II)
METRTAVRTVGCTEVCFVAEQDVNWYAVKIDGGIVVIDTGYGEGIRDGLRRLDIDPKDVASIILTHAHIDHYSGLIDGSEVVFPSATVWLAKKELAYWNCHDGGKFAEIYRIETFEPVPLGAKGNPLFAGITPFAAYGHTPGHTAVLVESRGEALLVTGDLICDYSVQFSAPDVTTDYDYDKPQSAETRKLVLEYAAKNDIPITGSHLPFPAVGKVTRVADGFAFAEL